MRRFATVVALSVVVFGIAGVSAPPAAGAPTAGGANCSQTSVGFVPLTDEDGLGLYENGNTIPASHAANAPAITPIGGVVGVVSLGMSNAYQEFGTFMETVDGLADVSPLVKFANGAVGGQPMNEWADPTDNAWDVSLERIKADGLAASEVQIVWMKMGSQLGQLKGSQSERIEAERGWLTQTIANAKAVFPNLKRVYMSSRIYAGYNDSPNHNEPETGFDNGLSVKTVVADSIAGKTAVWAAWGPYLWADGTKERSDGLTWECADFVNDGVHPSTAGELKVTNLLVEFLSTDETTCGWFLADPGGCGTPLLPPPPPPCEGSDCGDPGQETRFLDVPATHLFFADIEWLAAEGITLGCNPPANTNYCPDAEVTRGQMAAFLDRALDLPNGPDAFNDDEGSVFEANINALAAAGITKGCNPPVNDRFCPDASVTRGQMAAFLNRALDLPSGGGDVFVDDDDSIFETDIEALALSGITKGCNPPTNDEFCPEAPVTRAQMAAFLHRAAPIIGG